MKSYADMTTKELRELLREDFQKPAGEEMSYDELCPILEALASRDGVTQEKTEKAWADFVRYYLPLTEE